MTVSDRKMKEIRALADACNDALIAVVLASRRRQAKRLEAKAARAR